MDLINDEIKRFIHNHTVLITVLETTDSNGSKKDLTTLHYWHQAEPTSVSIPISISPDDLQYISGFQNHGIIPVSTTADQISSEQLHTLLCRAIEEQMPHGKAQKNNVMNETLINQITDYLRLPCHDALRLQIPVRLYSITVASSTQDALFKEDRIWKWSKPSSPYRTNGRWFETLGETIADGKWSAGKHLSLLVAGVNKGQKESLFEDGSRPVVIPLRLRGVCFEERELSMDVGDR